MRQVVQTPALHCYAPTICHAENIVDLIWTIWGKETNCSLVLKTWALLTDQHTPTVEESSEEKGKKTMSLRNNVL